MSQPVSYYHFTLRAEDATVEMMRSKLVAVADQWVFQLELGETGYRHYQGQIHLKKKSRITTLKKVLGMDTIHLSPTSKTNTEDWSYASKQDTRVDGPWTSEDLPIPSDIQAIKMLLPWQNDVLTYPSDGRKVLVVLDQVGNIGKSTLVRFMECRKLGCWIPALGSYKELMGFAISFPPARLYIIDMPRALISSLSKKDIHGLWSAIETLKDGIQFDIRYKGRKRIIERPTVVVFTNEMPDLNMLSFDRWDFREVQDKQLVSRNCVATIPVVPSVTSLVDVLAIIPVVPNAEIPDYVK